MTTPIPITDAGLEELVEVRPIEHERLPAETSYQRQELRKRMEKYGPYIPASMLEMTALASPAQGSFAGSMWSLYEWATTMIDDRASLVHRLRTEQARAEKAEAEVARLVGLQRRAIEASFREGFSDGKRFEHADDAWQMSALNGAVYDPETASRPAPSSPATEAVAPTRDACGRSPGQWACYGCTCWKMRGHGAALDRDRAGSEVKS